MNRSSGIHVPSPEFRQRLEQDLVTTFRLEGQFGATHSSRWRQLRAVSLLLAGLAVGWGTAFARGQAQDAQERTRLLSVAKTEQELLAARLQLAQSALVVARANFQLGTSSREAVMAAESDVLDLRERVERGALDMAEMTASAQPARNELWAPLVAGRDFVLERLRLEATGTQRKLAAAEQNLQTLERARRLGTGGDGEVAAARLVIADAKRGMALGANRMDLRRRFVEEGLAPEVVARELKRFELNAEVEYTTLALELAGERADRAQQQQRIGVITDLDLKRAQLETLVLKVSLERLRAQLREVDKKE